MRFDILFFFVACSIFPKALILGLKRFWKKIRHREDSQLLSCSELYSIAPKFFYHSENFFELSNSDPKIFEVIFFNKLVFPIIIKLDETCNEIFLLVLIFQVHVFFLLVYVLPVHILMIYFFSCVAVYILSVNVFLDFSVFIWSLTVHFTIVSLQYSAYTLFTILHY